MTTRSLLAAAALLPVILTAAEVRVAFSNPKQSTILQPWARLDTSSGHEALAIDTRPSNGVWNPCYRTSEDLFQPGKTYEISFKCDMEENPGSDAYLLLLMRPAKATNHLTDIANLEVYATPPGDGVVRFRIKMPPSGEKSRQAFQIHTFKGVGARIADITVRELERASADALKTASLLAGVDDALTRAFPAVPVTGCPDFAVDLPAAPRHTFNAKDFGVSTDSPDNSAAFQAVLAHARKNRPAKIVVEPGVYRFGDAQDLLMDTTFDVEIDAQNSTFLFRKTKGKLFSVHHSERIAIRNLIVDWDWEADPLASFVEVAEKAVDGTYVDLRFVDYPEFPRKDVRVADLSECDRATRFMPPGGGRHFGFEFFKGREAARKLEWLGPNILRLHDSAARLDQMQPGQFFLMRHYVYDMNAFQLVNNHHVTFDNVHVRSCPGMGFLVHGVTDFLQISSSSVHPAPGSKRAIGSTADSIHAGSSRGRIRIENTVLGGGGDDTLNLHDGSCYALRLDDHRILTLNHNNLPGNYFWTGHPVEFRNEDFSPLGFTAKVIARKAVNPGRGQYEFTFDETLPRPAGRGFLVFNRNYGTRDVLIRGCTFHKFPRGILIAADNVTIENNLFDQGKAGAIKIESGYTMKVWSEGYGASNVLVRNNRFRQCNLMGRYDFEARPDIYISSYRIVDPSMDKARYPLFHDILIANNRFEGTTGAPVYIASAANVAVVGNVFDLSLPSSVPEPTRGCIVADSARNVSVADNIWRGGGQPRVHYDPDSVRDITLARNRAEP